MSTGASREALLAEKRSKSKVFRWRKTWRGDTGALLSRAVFAQSRNWTAPFALATLGSSQAKQATW